MGGKYPVISTNVELRRDGLPYAQQKRIEDPGVAVYFLRNGKQMVFACDRWDLVHDNIYAIGKTIEAMRGIERWGSSELMERAFSAFEALPAPPKWWEVLGVERSAAQEEIERAYRAKAKETHPNAGGSREAWDRVASAYEAARREMACCTGGISGAIGQ